MNEVVFDEPIQIDLHVAPWGFIARITTNKRVRNFVFEKGSEERVEEARKVLDEIIENLEKLKDDLGLFW